MLDQLLFTRVVLQIGANVAITPFGLTGAEPDHVLILIQALPFVSHTQPVPLISQFPAMAVKSSLCSTLNLNFAVFIIVIVIDISNPSLPPLDLVSQR
jgi:hypothetical protein